MGLYDPAVWDWDGVTQGDTYNAITLSCTGTDYDLSRVRIKFRDSDGTLQLTLDSNTSGVTIDTATAGAWEYTIGPISAALTGGMDAGVHSYDIEVTDASGAVQTHFKGCWEIYEQNTD